jgi:hemerythrin
MAHMSDEEELMKKYKFPSNLELAHKSSHVAIIRKVISFHDEMNTSIPSVNEAIIFCSTLLPTHIKT